MHQTTSTTDTAGSTGWLPRALQILAMVAVVAGPAVVFAAGGGGGGGAKEGLTASFWANWAVQLFNFAVFAGIVVYFLKGPGARYFAERREEMLSDLKEARRMREEAEARLEEYNAKLDAFEGEKQDLLDEYHEQGEREKERIIEEAKEQVEKMREQAERTIEQETRKAVAELEQQAVELAVDMAEDVIREKLDEERQKALLERYVSEISNVGVNGDSELTRPTEESEADADASRVAG